MITQPKHYLVAIVFFILTNATFAQKKHTVNNTPGTAADFTKVQDAINAAKAGDTIYIQHSATAYEDFTVNKKLYIYGRSHSLPNYITEVGAITLASGCSGTAIQALKGYSVTCKDDGANLSNIMVFNCLLDDISFLTEKNTRTLKNISIVGNVFPRIVNNKTTVLDSSCDGVLFANNVINRPIYIEDAKNLTFRNNIFYWIRSYLGFPVYVSAGYTIKITNCIFILNTENDVVLNDAIFDEDDAPQKTKMIYENCYTYNYYEGKKYDFFNDPRVELINCKANVNPLFVNVDASGGRESIAGLAGEKNVFNALEDDLHLQPNSPAKGAGVFGD